MRILTFYEAYTDPRTAAAAPMHFNYVLRLTRTAVVGDRSSIFRDRAINIFTEPITEVSPNEALKSEAVNTSK